MIYTLTPNPALDLGGNVSDLIPNEKAYVHRETRFAGGNAINAARILQKLGYPVIAGGFLGGGIGDEIKALLEEEGVHCHFTRIRKSTRVNVTVTHQKTFLQTRLSFPGPQIEKEEIQRLLNWISCLPLPAFLLIGGSYPPGFSNKSALEICKLSNRRKIPLIIDVPGHLLKGLISARPLLIKPNLIEFQDLTGKKVQSIQEVAAQARILNKKIPFICISSVEKGALLVTSDRIWFGKIPPIKVQTTVGAGDAMVGVMCAQLWKWKHLLHSEESKLILMRRGGELLRWGLAAAAATLLTPGTRLGEVDKIQEFLPKIKISEIYLRGKKSLKMLPTPS